MSECCSKSLQPLDNSFHYWKSGLGIHKIHHSSIRVLLQWASCKHINIPTQGGNITAPTDSDNISQKSSPDFTLTAWGLHMSYFEKLQLLEELELLMAAVLIQNYLQCTAFPQGVEEKEEEENWSVARSFTLITAPVSSKWRALSLLASWRSGSQRVPRPGGYKCGERGTPPAITLNLSLYWCLTRSHCTASPRHLCHHESKYNTHNISFH